MLIASSGDKVRARSASWVARSSAWAEISVNPRMPAGGVSPMAMTCLRCGSRCAFSCPGAHASNSGASSTSNYCGMLVELAPELEACAPGQLNAQRLPHLKHVIAMGETPPAGMWGFTEISAHTEDRATQLADLARTLSPDDAINIQFTSGTTGMPK